MAPPGGVDKNLLAPPRNYYGAADALVQGAGGVSGVVAWCIKNDTARGCCRCVAGGILGGVAGVLQSVLNRVLQGYCRVCRRLLHCSQLKGEQKSEGDSIWSKKETLTTQKGDSIFVFFRTVRKGPLGEGPGFPEGDPLGNSGVVGALCLKGSLL